MDILEQELLEEDEILTDPRENLLAQIDEMQTEVKEVKTDITNLTNSGDPITNGEIFKELSDLTNRANSILDVCKEDIERSSILDAELVSAYASLIKSTREIISDYLVIYRDRQKHLDKMELENIKQEHRKELVRLKDNLDNSIKTDTDETKVFVQEAVVEVLNNHDKLEEKYD